MILRHTAKGDTLTPSSGDEEPTPRRPASVGPRRERARERVVRGLESIPLTYRLVVILLVLLMAALTLSSFATSYLMRRDLLASTDQQLRSVKDPWPGSSSTTATTTGRCPTPTPSRTCPSARTAARPSTRRRSRASPRCPTSPRRLAGRHRPALHRPSTDGTTEWRFIAGTVDTQGTTYAVGIPFAGSSTPSPGCSPHLRHRRRRVDHLRRARLVRHPARPATAAQDRGRRRGHRRRRPQPPRPRPHEPRRGRLALGLAQRHARSHRGLLLRPGGLRDAHAPVRRRRIARAAHALATVRGYAELYRQGAIADEVALDTSMQRIEGEASRMSVLVDDLLTLARLGDERPSSTRRSTCSSCAPRPRTTPAPATPSAPSTSWGWPASSRRSSCAATTPGCARSSATCSPTPSCTPAPGCPSRSPSARPRAARSSRSATTASAWTTRPRPESSSASSGRTRRGPGRRGVRPRPGDRRRPRRAAPRRGLGRPDPGGGATFRVTLPLAA